MGTFKECDTRLKSKLELITKSFNNTICNVEIDTSGNKIYGFEQNIIKSIPQKGSSFKDNTVYVKGDIVSYNGAMYVCKTSTQGNNPTDYFYFRRINTDLKFLGVGFNVRGYVSSNGSSIQLDSNKNKTIINGISKGITDDGYTPTTNNHTATFSIDFNINNLQTFVSFMEPSMIKDFVDGNEELVFPHANSILNDDGKFVLNSGGAFEEEKKYSFNSILLRMG